MTNENQTDIKVVVDDLEAAIATVKKGYTTYKTGGIASMAPMVKEVEEEVSKDISDFKKVIPIVKDGFRTTEFWLVLGYSLIVAGFHFSGHPLNIDTNATLGAVIGIYTASRTLVKK